MLPSPPHLFSLFPSSPPSSTPRRCLFVFASPGSFERNAGVPLLPSLAPAVSSILPLALSLSAPQQGLPATCRRTPSINRNAQPAFLSRGGRWWWWWSGGGVSRLSAPPALAAPAAASEEKKTAKEKKRKSLQLGKKRKQFSGVAVYAPSFVCPFEVLRLPSHRGGGGGALREQLLGAFQEVGANAATDLGDRKAKRPFLPAAFVTAGQDGARPGTSGRCERRENANPPHPPPHNPLHSLQPPALTALLRGAVAAGLGL